jgi:hypothetical protein
MPNWCANKLTISEITPELEAFLKDEQGFSFERIAKPNRPESDNAGWDTVSAQVDAWGTKWDLGENEAKEVTEFLLEHNSANFDTAWSPPINAIEALSKMFPEIGFTLAYYEPGMSFYGITEFYDGMTSDDCRNIGDKAEYAAFLVEEFGYEQEDAEEAAGISEEEE